MRGFIGRFMRAIIVLVILLLVIVINNIRLLRSEEAKEPQLYVHCYWAGWPEPGYKPGCTE